MRRLSSGWPSRAQLGGQLDHRGLHLEGGSHGALGVVLVDGRHAEDRQHGVAGELLDEALVARDLGAQAVEGPGDQGLDELRVGRLVEAGEADQVGEDHRRDLALPTRLRLPGRAASQSWRGRGSSRHRWRWAPEAPSSGAGVPQAGQKRASSGRAVPQIAQARSVGVPQAGQKRVPGSRARPQDRQFTRAS